MKSINTFIAFVYGMQRKLAGIFVALGSLVAVVFEVLSISASAVWLDAEVTTNGFYLILSGFGGLLLASLMLKMSMTNATKLRLSMDKEHAIQNAFRERCKMLSAKDVIASKAVMEREVQDAKSGRWSVYVLVGLGAFVSMIGESYVLSHLVGTSLGGMIAALAIGSIATLTVVSGELHAGRDTDIILQSLQHNAFTESAVEANVVNAINTQFLKESAKYIERTIDANVLDSYARVKVCEVIEKRMGVSDFGNVLEIAQQKQMVIESEQEAAEREEAQRLVQVSQFLLTGDSELLKVESSLPERKSELLKVESKPTVLSESTLKVPMNEPETSSVTFKKLKYTEKVEQLIQEHPDWSNSQMARSIGCSVTTVATERNRLREYADNILLFRKLGNS